VSGLQVDGYFPDSSTFNATHGWQHDSQFVLRIPDDWNGGLVVAGAPGNRKQYSSDFLISDYVLDQGFAYAATDKGNNGVTFYLDGNNPADAVAEWHERVTQLAIAAKGALREHFGHRPERTYMAGISNGGYLVRWPAGEPPGTAGSTGRDPLHAGRPQPVQTRRRRCGTPWARPRPMRCTPPASPAAPRSCGP
jgi:poly(3-hydroxybutyrate) depolymerase